MILFQKQNLQAISVYQALSTLRMKLFQNMKDLSRMESHGARELSLTGMETFILGSSKMEKKMDLDLKYLLKMMKMKHSRI